MSKIIIYKKESTIFIFFVSTLFSIMFFIPGFVQISLADSKNMESRSEPVSEKNIDRWKSMSQTEKEHFRELNKKYQSMSVEQQAFLRQKMKAFKKLPKNIQSIILDNYHMLEAFSKEERKSFFRLIRKYRNLPTKKKKLVNRTFKKIKTLPKTKQQELFKRLIEEQRSENPDIRGVIKRVLIREGLKD